MTAEEIMYDPQVCRQTYDVIVVGMGPVGLRFIEEIVGKNSRLNIAIFGDEPWEPYDRIKLSSLISGEIKESSLFDSAGLSRFSSVTAFYNNHIACIDRYANEVVDFQGKRYGYKHLVLATGSHPHIPAIDGYNLNNVFCFRDLNDAFSLMGRSVRTRTTVVIGGGLLGLEAARAMQRFNTAVHVIEHEVRLMFKQLDKESASRLEEHVTQAGVKVHLSQRVKRISGKDKVEGVELADGTMIACDTVILATGIVPNIDIAVEAGLHVGKGIRVNDSLRTNDGRIYAVGECAEHNGEVYGLVGPGFEQAAVAADVINDNQSVYKGSISATQLKVVGLPVFSAGIIEYEAHQVKEYIYVNKDTYRKIICRNNRIIGVVGVGQWPGVQRFHEAVEKKRRLWPWQTRGFVKSGVLWNDSDSENVVEWPATATVCNCKGVTRGQLDEAVKSGARTISGLALKTGASTVCGSCSNLLCDYMGGNAERKPVKGAKILLLASVLAMLSAVLFFILPSIGYLETVQINWRVDVLWRDGLIKQISGFSILAVSVFVSIISFRKRINRLNKLWAYTSWRLVHVVAGLLVVALLFGHTGFSLGNNLNLYLMLSFCGLMLVGAVAGVVISMEHNMPARMAKQLRLYAVWSHILLLWPLPALLGFHIFKTYYF